VNLPRRVRPAPVQRRSSCLAASTPHLLLPCIVYPGEEELAENDRWAPHALSARMNLGGSILGNVVGVNNEIWVVWKLVVT
jgi:hypothetical protein